MLISLFKRLDQKTKNNHALVLSAAGIYFTAVKEKAGWHIRVHEHDAAEALFHIRKYEAENPVKNKTEAAAPVYRKIDPFTGIGAAAILMAVHVAVGTAHESFVDRYGASASKIMAGEVYRTVTALLLHADAAHLAGNMAGIAIFGAVVCAVNGAGVGWLMVVLSGALGNYLNAALYESNHLAVGASTAVFGAVGILAAHQFWQKIRHREKRPRAWLPIAGGLALLAMLGVGEGRVDIMAHLLGFCCGMVSQFVYQAVVFFRPQQVLPFPFQAAGLVVCAGMVLLACIWPEMY